LTKVYEEIFRGTVSAALAHFREPIGEFTLVIEGKPKGERVVTAPLEEELRRLYQEGLSAKEAVSQVAKVTGVPKKELYRAWLRLG
jgi:16S rRNA (cytidine1402-2'-O)-methyltransferase